jgi:hypothetical protein
MIPLTSYFTTLVPGWTTVVRSWRARRILSGRGFENYSLRGHTLDRIGRFAWLAIRMYGSRKT